MRIWNEPGLIDRCGSKRNDGSWLAEQWYSPKAQIIILDERLNPCMAPGDTLFIDRPNGKYDPQQHLFLGQIDGVSYFAIADSVQPGIALREAMRVLPDHQLALAVEAVAFFQWLRRSMYCEICGSKTIISGGGFSKYCPTDQRELFPRHNPAMIVAITDRDDRLLLAHQRSWAQGRFSVLAGFVEAGESVEQTVHREVREEVGIEVTDVTYVTSQPWPFPDSLMLAYRATALSTTITVDGVEIEQAQFFSREEVRDHVAKGTMTLAGPGSVSEQLINSWLKQGTR